MLLVVMTLHSIGCVQDHFTFRAVKLLLSMAHIFVSPHGKVCESLVTYVTDSLIVSNWSIVTKNLML